MHERRLQLCGKSWIPVASRSFDLTGERRLVLKSALAMVHGGTAGAPALLVGRNLTSESAFFCCNELLFFPSHCY